MAVVDDPNIEEIFGSYLLNELLFKEDTSREKVFAYRLMSEKGRVKITERVNYEHGSNMIGSLLNPNRDFIELKNVVLPVSIGKKQMHDSYILSDTSNSMRRILDKLYFDYVNSLILDKNSKVCTFGQESKLEPIYFFLDNSIKAFILPKLDKISTPLDEFK